MRHFIIITLLIILSTLAIHMGIVAIGPLPVSASTQALSIDPLFDFYIWGIAFLFSLIMVILVYGLIVFRRRPGETGDGTPIEGNNTLEVAWTAIPLLIVIY